MERREFLKLSLAGGAAMLFDASSFAAALAQGDRPKTLVLGGGAFALGYALAHPGETLVLERGLHLAADFACTCGPVEPGAARTALGRELLAGLSNCGILGPMASWSCRRLRTTWASSSPTMAVGRS